MATHQYAKEYWDQLFKEHIESNLTIAKFCQTKQLRPNIFCYWRTKLRPELMRKTQKNFKPVKLIKEPQISQVNINLITSNGTKVIIPGNINYNTLKNLINIICG